MMSRMKFVMLSLVAAFALSATAVSTASAHEFLVNGTPLASGATEGLQGEQNLNTIYQFESVVKGTSIHITCQETLIGSEKNFLEGGNPGKAKLFPEFKACTGYSVNTKTHLVENLPECKTKVTSTQAEGELTGPGELTLRPKSGSSFAEVEFATETGACTIAGTFKVEGNELCTLPHFAVEGAVAQLECNPGGSSLKLGGTEPAKFYGGFALASTKGNKFSSN